MLFAKDFKTALAVVAATGLLGVGTAHATVLLSEDDATGAAASNPVYFAAEAYPAIRPASPSKEGGTPNASSTSDHNLHVQHLEVDIALLRGDRYFLRFDLEGGMEFGPGYTGDLAKPILFYSDGGQRKSVGTNRIRAGGDGDTYGIYNFTVREDGGTGTPDATGGTPASGDTEVDDLKAAGGWNVEWHALSGSIVVPRNQSAITQTCYGVRMRLYDSVTDARSGNAGIIDARATLMCFVPTVGASVTAPKELTASVAEGFRRFVGEGSAATRGTLATAKVTLKTQMSRGSGTTARKLQILNPDDGENITAGDVLKDVEFTLKGTFTHSQPFEFGEFKLGAVSMSRLDDDGDAISAAVAKTAAGKASTDAVTGKVTAPGDYAIVVDVSGNTAASAYSQIGQGSYTAEWEIDQVDPGTGKGTAQDPAGGDAKAGSITRDGTTVRIGYLQAVTEYTNSENDVIGWNQRLVITNHSSVGAEVTLSNYHAGDGVEVTCKADDRWECGDDEELVTNVDANSQLVLKVADMIDIEGGGRTAGMLTIAADASQISVATTHVTLPGGQTDTVRYWPLQ